MEEIIVFKRAVLQGELEFFFNNFIASQNTQSQNVFITKLKEQNLDLFFLSVLKQTDNFDKLDKEIAKRLKQEFLLEKGRDQFYKNQYYEILEKSDFPILLMKGWALRNAIDNDLYKRSCDIDVLVSEQDYERASDFLHKDFNFYTKPNYLAYGQDCLLNANGMCIDLHKKLIAFQAFDSILKLSAKELFKESEIRRIENRDVLVFKPEMKLLHLCIHFLLHHQAVEFILLYELKEFIRLNFQNINTEKLKEIARKHNMLSGLVYTLMIIESLCMFSNLQRLWLKDFIQRVDHNNLIKKNFESSFNKDDFYRDIPLSRKVIKRLLIQNLQNELSYYTGIINFSIYCNLKFLGSKLKSV